jgi:hypothetical protein
MSNRDLSYRIHQEHRQKSDAKRKAKEWDLPTDDKSVGKMASVHGVMCSCEMCGNPRKYFEEKSLQEEKSDEAFVDELMEIDGSDVVFE